MPQNQYRNNRALPLNRYGGGPFCHFRISTSMHHAGVYAVVANQEVIYIGECQNLPNRFNDGGYGTIHPRNCFKGGQSTNCRINALILGAAKQGCEIDLWFHASSDRYDVERRLILELRPRWNVQHGKRAALISIGTETDSAKCMSKPTVYPGNMTTPIFKLTLHRTYYDRGFFNVTIAFDQYIRSTDGGVELIVGASGLRIEGRVNRKANRNKTARIIGGRMLKDWFRRSHKVGDVVDVDLSSVKSIRIH